MENILSESKNNNNGPLEGNERVTYPNPVSSTQLTQRDQRALVFHLLYALEAFDYSTSLESIAENISREYGFIILGSDPVFLAAAGVSAETAFLDGEIQPLLANWRFERLSSTTRIIVRYALWEMLRLQTPASIVINEAVELAKCFAETNAYRFVNGILDEWARKNGLRDQQDSDSTPRSESN